MCKYGWCAGLFVSLASAQLSCESLWRQQHQGSGLRRFVRQGHGDCMRDCAKQGQVCFEQLSVGCVFMPSRAFLYIRPDL